LPTHESSSTRPRTVSATSGGIEQKFLERASQLLLKVELWRYARRRVNIERQGMPCHQADYMGHMAWLSRKHIDRVTGRPEPTLGFPVLQVRCPILEQRRRIPYIFFQFLVIRLGFKARILTG
jgi:hypothetical protein